MSAAVAQSVLPTSRPPLRIAIIADLLEENWPSMDRVAAMLDQCMQTNHQGEITAELIRPKFKYRFSRSATARKKFTLNADRLLNRFFDYPVAIHRLRQRFDVFHIIDHSYAHLVHSLPASRTLVTCHDLDTFCCLLNPDARKRSIIFRAMTRRILSGLQRAAAVATDSVATRDDLLRFDLTTPDRVEVIPLGVAPVFNPRSDPVADADCARLLGVPDPTRIELLHVGAPIPRKRIDWLLQIVSRVGKRLPSQLIRVGGPLTPGLRDLAARLGLVDSIVSLPRIDDAVLAAVYRRAALLLMTSDAEGLGLPVIEAMACGLPVVATDLPVMREVAGDAAEYAPANDLDAWCATIASMLIERHDNPSAWNGRRDRGLTRAARFSWAHCAATTVALYQRLAS